MPPTLISSAAAVATAGNVANPTTLSPALPATRANGDVLLLLTECRSPTPTVATPSGWAELLNIAATNGRIALFSRAVDGSETAPSVVWSGLTTGNSGTPAMARIACFRGLELPVSIDVSGAASNQAASTTVAAGGAAITTLTDDALVLVLSTRQDDAGTWATLAASDGVTWAKVTATSTTTSGSDMAMEWQYGVKATAGSITAKSFSLSGASSFASSGVMIALDPVVAVVDERTGGAAASGVGGGPSKIETAKTNGGEAPLVAGGSVKREIVKTGGASASCVGGASKQIQAVETGGASAPASGGGSDQTSTIKAGGASSALSGGGPDQTSLGKVVSGGATASRSSGGSDQIAVAKAGGSSAQLSGGGPDELLSPALAKSGGASASGSGGGSEQLTVTRSGGSSSTRVGGGPRELLAPSGDKTGGASVSGFGGAAAVTDVAKSGGSALSGFAGATKLVIPPGGEPPPPMAADEATIYMRRGAPDYNLGVPATIILRPRGVDQATGNVIIKNGGSIAGLQGGGSRAVATTKDGGATIEAVAGASKIIDVSRRGGARIGTLPPIASTPVLDNFNRPDGPVGPSWIYPAYPGEQEPVIVNNQVTATGSAGYWGAVLSQQFAADQEVYATIAQVSGSGSWMWLYGRTVGLEAQFTAYTLIYDPSSGYFGIERYVNAGWGDLGWLYLPSPAPGVGTQLCLRVIGSSIQGWMKPPGGEWQLIRTAFDSTITGPGRIGLSLDSGQIVLDDFGGGEVVSVGGLQGGGLKSTDISKMGGAHTGVLPSIASTPVLDDFNRPDGPLGPNWSSPIYPEGWATAITSNQIRHSLAHAWQGAVWNQQLPADQEAHIEIPDARGWTYIYVRLPLDPPYETAATTSSYAFGIGPGLGWVLEAYTPDYVGLASGDLPVDFGDGSAIGLRAVGNVIEAWHRPFGGAWTRLARVVDNSLTGSGHIGFDHRSDTVGIGALDNFGGGAVVSVGGLQGGGSRLVEVSRMGGAILGRSGGGTRMVSATKLGGAASSRMGGGSRVVSATKTGGARAIFSGGGSRVASIAKSGGAIRALAAGGTRVVSLTKTGGATARFIGGGQRIVSTIKSGGSSAIFVAGGTRVATVARSGGAISARSGGAAKLISTLKDGGAAVGFIGGGSRLVAIAKSGGGLLGMSGGGAKLTSITRSGGASIVSRAGGDKLIGVVRTGGGVQPFVGGGVQVVTAAIVKTGGAAMPHVGGGPATFGADTVKVGGASMSLVGGGTQQVSLTRSGGAVATFIGGGTRVLTSVRTGGARLVLSSGGTKVISTARTGGGRLVFVGRGSGVITAIKMGGAITARSGGGARQLVIAKIGGGSRAFAGGGSRLLNIAKAGGGRMILIGGGARRISMAKSGGGILGLFGGGAGQVEFANLVITKVGGASIISRGGGSRMVDAAKAGGGRLGFVGGGYIFRAREIDLSPGDAFNLSKIGLVDSLTPEFLAFIEQNDVLAILTDQGVTLWLLTPLTEAELISEQGEAYLIHE